MAASGLFNGYVLDYLNNGTDNSSDYQEFWDMGPSKQYTLELIKHWLTVDLRLAKTEELCQLRFTEIVEYPGRTVE